MELIISVLGLLIFIFGLIFMRVTKRVFSGLIVCMSAYIPQSIHAMILEFSFQKIYDLVFYLAVLVVAFSVLRKFEKV